MSLCLILNKFSSFIKYCFFGTINNFLYYLKERYFMKLFQLGLLTSILFLGSHNITYAESFDVFLKDVRADIVKEGIDATIFDRAMVGVEAPIKKVNEKLKKQPESVFTFTKYLNRLASDLRIKNGMKKKELHQADLLRIEKEYDLPQEVMLSLWGVESAYGALTGNFKIIPSLASLAYDSHRREFFRKELIKAVKIVNEGHIGLDDLTGSWAGAMGQCQFMPSSFFNFAADGNGDGRKDIWQTEADVFASTANYITKSGWKNDVPWGEAVTLTKILPHIKLSSRGLSGIKPLSYWHEIGVAHKTKNKGATLDKSTKTRLFMPDGPSKRAYLVYNNFDVIMRWNRSSYFAFSVLTLADQLAGKERL